MELFLFNTGLLFINHSVRVLYLIFRYFSIFTRLIGDEFRLY